MRIEGREGFQFFTLALDTVKNSLMNLLYKYTFNSNLFA
jgi:hypothetical protein